MNVEELLTDFNWKANGSAAVLEKQLLGELHALEAANVHAVIQSDERVRSIVDHIDKSLAELDSMESWLSLYAAELNSMGDDIREIEIQNRALQILNTNQLALMSELDNLLIWHLYLTQGVMFGLGASFVWFPCISAPQEWFSSRRGLAIGLTMCGSGVGGLIMSNISQAIILALDYRWALRISGFITFFFLVLATIFVRAPSRKKKEEEKSVKNMLLRQKELLKNFQFDILLLVGFITTFGYLVPSFLLPSYANSLHLNPWIGTNLSAIMSAINAVSKLVNGFTSDRIGRVNVLFLCTFLSGIFSLCIWTNAHSEATIWVFAVLYGFFGAGYLTLFPASLPQVAGYENITPANGLLYFTNTFGYLFGTPIASAIINRSQPPNYTYAAVWGGLLMAIGGLFCLVLRVMRAGWNPLVKV
ncbi:hypothetical protein RMCBS344292_03392 [Rhizopus microsporus]|nr:hypothetical protein RMCBS344292_03392 [Rhizopus microsporus]